MKREYDFTLGKRGAVSRFPPGKTRITIRIDDDILDAFRARVHAAGGGSYQSLINEALREHLESGEETLKETVRSVVREELAKYGRKQKAKPTSHGGKP
ncbi:MAG TPA: BrnA antitoxin family protein [Acidobacteriota bacterium]|nr:BrnA antitoxin family protein [Acidobacteriota bacterium]